MYCVYLTHYKGTKLPPLYVGSTSIEKINNGYRGSVLSKKWKLIWTDELTNNPQLFSVSIIKTFDNRQDALKAIPEKDKDLMEGLISGTI